MVRNLEIGVSGKGARLMRWHGEARFCQARQGRVLGQRETHMKWLAVLVVLAAIGGCEVRGSESKSLGHPSARLKGSSK